MDVDLGSRSHQKIESVDYVTTPPGKQGSGVWTECVLTVTSSSQFSQNLSIKYLLCVRPLGAGRGKLLGLLVIVKWSKAWETDKTDLADSRYLMSELGLCLAWAMYPMVQVSWPLWSHPRLSASQSCVHLCICLCDHRCRGFAHTVLSCACAPTYLSESVCVCEKLFMHACLCVSVYKCLRIHVSVSLCA